MNLQAGGVLGAEKRRPSMYAAVGKRVLDVVLVMLFIPIALPIAALIALAILFIDGRGVFYRASRVGARGRDFSIIKFRTMVKNSDAVLAQWRETHPHVHAEFEKAVKLREDPRITRVGRVLRRTSLDELPQLLNVLKGDMSLVGPRPVTRREWESFYGDRAETVFRSRPGITGYWQVSGRSLVPYAERIDLDLTYAERCGLGTDLGILVRTIPTVLRGHGAF